MATCNQQEEKSLPIIEDDKFFTRIMSKETSIANSSLRVYYGGACGSIPFNWETAPGTPKASIGEETSNLPPLTPPPSYYSNPKSTQKKRHSLSMTDILPRMLGKPHFSPSSSMSSSSSSSFSSRSSFTSKGRKSRVYSSSRSVVAFGVDDDKSSEDDDRRVVKGFWGCYLIGNVKSRLFCFIGRGPASH